MNGSSKNDAKEKYPHFFIVGAMKAGTSSLHHALSQHPDIFVSANKEPNHFCTDLIVETLNKKKKWQCVADERQYLELFQKATGSQKIGECSHTYLYSRVQI